MAAVCVGAFSVMAVADADAASPCCCGDAVQGSYGGSNASTINVTFVVDGVETSTITQTIGYNYKLPGTEPSKTGYAFQGWYRAEGGQGGEITIADTVEETEDFKVYAYFMPVTVTVTFMSDGAQIDRKNETYDQPYVLPTQPTKTGYDFAGWWTGENGTGTQITADSTVKTTKSITLYAYWTVHGCTVTFDANGGTVDGKDTEDVPASYGSKLSCPTPVRTGYRFAGWWTEKTGGTQFVSGSEWTSTSDTTLYAHWTAETYTVVFDAAGGTVVGGSTATATYDSVFTFDRSAVRSGYKFLGWFTESGTQVVSGMMVWQTAGGMTLYAHWQQSSFTVTFNANGGVITSSGTATATVGEKFVFTQTATRTGYTLEGWYTETDGGEKISSGDVWTFAYDTVLYAHWTANQYTVTFDANDGTLYGPSKVAATYGSAFEFTTTATRTGYVFDHWDTDKEGKGISYKSGDIWNIAGGVTLYAIWFVKTTQVTFDANGGTPVGGYVLATCESSFYFNKTTARDGYTFLGWYTEREGGVKIESGETWTIDEAYVVLYAHWEAASYTVAFNANGGDLSGEQYASATYGETFEFGQTATRTGYTFKEWNTASDGSGICIASGDTWNFTADTTLYAQWTANTYKVTYEACGGTFDEGSETSATATYGSVFEIRASVSRTGYTFDGWFTAAEGGEEFVSGSVWGYAADVILHAHWTAGTSTVTFDANGGDLKGDTSAIATYGFEFDFNQTAVRTGYTFSGWNTASDGSGTDVASGSIWEFTTDITLYARWTADTYTVTFDAGEGTLSGGETATAAYGSAFVFGQTAFREGYGFLGWFTAQEGGREIVSGDVWNITSDTVLYAQWVAGSSVVTFDANGGLLTGAPKMIVAYDSVFSFDQTAARTGYTFAGWNTAADGSGIAVETGYTWPFREDVTLYAQWTANTYTVTFDANGGTFDTGSITVDTATYGSVFEIRAAVSREGFGFLGWFTSQTEGTEVVSGDIWNIASDITLYAHWSDTEFKVTFDANGGELVGKRTATALLDTAFVFDQKAVRTGYVFLWWNTSADGTGITIVSGETWAIKEDITLYAQWTRSTTVVHFDANGGTTDAQDVTVTYGQACGINATADRSDYDFKGWNTKADGSGEYITADTVWSYDVAEITLYAQWQDNPHSSSTTTFIIIGAIVATVVAIISICLIKKFET